MSFDSEQILNRTVLGKEGLCLIYSLGLPHLSVPREVEEEAD